MPIGELAMLLAAFIYAITAVLDKLMTRSFLPLPLSALAVTGGSLFALVIMFITGEASKLPDTPVAYLALSAAGSVLALCIGMPLYFRFLTSVDVSKASPIMSGLQALLAVFIGLVLLGEDSSPLRLAGIAAIVVGMYVLTFSQRRQAEGSEAKWLGLKGMLVLLFIVATWTGGTLLQKLAVDEAGAVLVNAVRLVPVVLFLSMMATTNMDFLLGSDTRVPSRSPKSLRRRRRTSSGLRRPGAMANLFYRPRMLHVPYWARRRAPRQPAVRHIPARIRPPVYWEQLDSLGEGIRALGGEFVQVEGGRGRGGLRYRIDLPGAYAPEATLTAMPEVAAARWTGQWARTQRVEIALHPPDEKVRVGLGPPLGGGGPLIGVGRVRIMKMGRRSFLPVLLPVVSGALSMGLASFLMLVALKEVGLAVTQVLMSTQLVWIALMSAFVLRERLGWKTMAGIGATVVGVVLVVL